EKVVLALTFASVPQPGVLDPDLLYRIMVAPTPRYSPSIGDGFGLEAMVKYISAVKKKYLKLKPAEIRATPEKNNQVKLQFLNFPGGTFSQTVDLNKTVTVTSPGGH